MQHVANSRKRFRTLGNERKPEIAYLGDDEVSFPRREANHGFDEQILDDVGSLVPRHYKNVVLAPVALAKLIDSEFVTPFFSSCRRVDCYDDLETAFINGRHAI